MTFLANVWLNHIAEGCEAIADRCCHRFWSNEADEISCRDSGMPQSHER